MPRTSAVTPEKFTTFGELLRFLRRKADLTQRELSIAVGYSESQISRLEKNERAPEEATLAARFVPALYIDDEPKWVARLLELGATTHSHAPEADAPQPIAEAKSTPNNLPIQLTSFIGREKEIAEVKQDILNERLVTLTGSGGCGKTRLALQSASGLLDVFQDGVWLIELTPLADPTLVPQTIAMVLGLKEEVGRPLINTLTDHLRSKQILLILDNCEHLVEASAQLAESLLHACPEVHVLATSRQILGVAGEKNFLVPSLSSPDPLYPTQVDTLNQYESIRLFVDRAVATLPVFSVTADNAPAVAQVCHRLDGIPLAIELAAARVNLLRVEQIASRLNDRFHLLTNPTRRTLPRHQTLRAAIDWSHDLLTESERILLRRLSVFAGGWTLEAAEAVCVGEGIESAEILDLLTELVNKSLVLAKRAKGEEARYQMLETIRQYVLEKLTASGEADIVWRKHATHYLALAKEDGSFVALIEPAQLDRVETEHDNMRAALAWSQSAMGNAELGLRLARALSVFWYYRGHWSEMRGWLEGALEHAEAAEYPRANAWALDALGSVLIAQGDYAAGQVRLERSLALFQELSDFRSCAMVLAALGLLARERGDTVTARIRLEEGLALYRELGDKENAAMTLVTLGEVAVMQEDAIWATTLLEEGLTLNRDARNAAFIGWALNHLGHVAQLQSDYSHATQLHEESMLLFKELEVNTGIAHAFQSLGETALGQGAVTIAVTHLSKALGLFRDLGDRMGVSWCLAGLGGVAALDEEPERAAWLWGAAEALRQSIGARQAPATRATRERLQAEVRKHLGDAAFNAKWAEGQSASVEKAVAEATR